MSALADPSASSCGVTVSVGLRHIRLCAVVNQWGLAVVLQHVTDLEAVFDGRLTYHSSCHLLRGLGVKEAATQLLAQVRGAEVVPLPHADECCGFGGLFSVKHGDLSAAMLDKKLENVRATGASTVVGCDMSCLMHMQGGLSRDGTPIQCWHLAEVLASASHAKAGR